ncbi:LPXTG cell wall anchor domain-containing protein [Vagococcus fluvialis]|uniref:LPXTG cell wall anchor domain-containing protein n=1 Tax=Vagococcus fluvialis TaxID=2738 RepID=A0A7X6D9X6_9ENTE|nr:LPXTG cell wall anchor domain-containing protein [Vagococcus fluvialis]NKC68417.1 LPXTG cell wall anchor domain-containing protein [Vagococcus fluvialis]
MKKRNIYPILLIIFLVTFGLQIPTVEAADGQVSVPSGITFIKGDEVPTPKPKEPKEPKKTIIDSGKEFLPKTGEVVTKASLYGVSLLILGSVYWIVLRRRKKNEE